MRYLIPRLVISLSKKQNNSHHFPKYFHIIKKSGMCVAAMILCMIVLIVTRKRGDGRYCFAL
jgi:amino acid permease